MRNAVSLSVLVLALSPLLASAVCTPNTTDVYGLQSLLQNGGAGYILSLCEDQMYNFIDVLNYTAAGQEISTENYPTDATRAMIVQTGNGISGVIQGNNAGLDGCALRNIQINGNRGDSPIYTAPSANIEMGGANANQTIEYVRSYDPRGWSCMHISEGPFSCINTTIQNNDIGPCGSSYFQNWADGISLSCQKSLVQNNDIVDATDGGIVVFGAPYSTIRNNTIHVLTRTMLGGINLVDVLPWQPEGNYSGTVVENNYINGGFATNYGNQSFGYSNSTAIIKVGIAVGPRVWWGDGRYGTNQSMGGVIQNNVLSGAFAYGMGVSSARNFVIQNNTFTGNVSFIASLDVNCTTGDELPHSPTALLYESTSIDNCTMSVPSLAFDSATSDNTDNVDFAFVNGTVNGLICMSPFSSTVIAWPYGWDLVNSGVSASTTNSTTTSTGRTTTSSGAGSSSAAATSGGTAVSTAKSGAGRLTYLPGWGAAIVMLLLPVLLGSTGWTLL